MTSRGERDALAPVIPLFGAGAGAGAAAGEDEYVVEPADGYDACREIEREIAERNLTRKLGARSLSVREARGVVAERDLSRDAIDALLAEFLRRGYLDDAALAEQLVRAGVERKGQGRQVLAQTLAKRGIPRDVADTAIAGLPDDDAERALAFARTRARGMRSVPADAALRRLVGQLSRRGYAGSAAMDAARQALAEAASSP